MSHTQVDDHLVSFSVVSYVHAHHVSTVVLLVVLVVVIVIG